MARPSLFRRETEDARANAWLGRVLLVRPASFALFTLAAAVVTLALGILFVFGEYTRKARVAGVLVPAGGVVRILAQQAGVVQAIHAREGEAVARDAPLVVIVDGQQAGAAVSARIGDRLHALAQQRSGAIATSRAEQSGLERRVEGISAELARIDSEMDTQAARTSLARHALARAEQMRDIGFMAPAALDQQRETALDQEARLKAMGRTRLALEREKATLEFDLDTARSRGEAQVAALDLQRAGLEQERVERGLQYRAAIVAPASGTIATVLVENGQTVTPGMPLVTLIPANATLEAHLYSPSRSIGFVHSGQEVLLRYLAYPHQKFGLHKATVVAVSRNPTAPGELGFTPPDGSREPLYRIKAELDGQAIRAYGRLEPLQPGMQVEADILLDRRRLIEWIFEPLLSLAGRA
jgi:membrane fusion protein